MTKTLRHFISIFLILILLCCSSMAFGRDLTYRFPKDQVMAAYLYNFALFSQWPESAFEDQDTFVIATFDQGFADLAAETLAGRKVGKRPIEVRFIHHIKDSVDVQIVLLSDVKKGKLAEILSFISRQPILTVGLLPDFTSAGGMIELFTVDRRLRFAINLDAVKSSGLTISSEVLRLAERVETKGHAETVK